MQLYYIIGFTIFFAITFVHILKRDVVYAGFYLFFFIYNIFFQVAYAYFPELSILLNAYFGEEIFYRNSIFVFLSFLTLYILFRLFHDLLINRLRPWKITEGVSYSGLFYLILTMHILYASFMFIISYNQLDYSNNSEEDPSLGGSVFLTIFGLLFKFSVYIILCLYVLVRMGKRFNLNLNSRLVKIFLILEIILFLNICIKLGNRTDILAVSIGAMVFEFFLFTKVLKRRIGFARIFGIVGMLSIVAVLLNFISSIREEKSSSVQPWLVEKVIYNDYTAPGHLLIGAMGLNYIDPKQVFASNVANSLMGLNYPYLQKIVGDKFTTAVQTRSASLACYIFTEGFVVMGFFGFLYNGLITFLGITFWRRLSSSSNLLFNLFLIAIVSTQFANIARSQSMYFFKTFYLFFIPAILLFSLATGFRPAFGSKK